MKTLLAVALSFWPCVGICDLADEDPERLCVLLNPYRLVLTEYVQVDEGRPLCFVTDQPTSIAEDGYEFSYRVIAHHTHDHPDSLFVEVSGSASKILGQRPQRQFAEMVSVVLSELYSEEVVSDIALAIESISPGFNRSMTVNGIGVQLIAKDYSQYFATITTGFSIRVNLSNVCQFHGHSELQADCIQRSNDPIGSLRE